MAEIFQGQIDYIFFFYGLSFLILSGVCFVLAREEGNKFPWMWLGMFGVLHGINEWLDLVAVSVADTEVFRVLRLFCLAVSFIFLFDFARRSISVVSSKSVGLWVYIPFFIFAFLGAFLGINAFNVTVRYSFGFSSGIVASWALYKFAFKRSGAFKKWLLGLSLSMGVYALAAGLVVPKADFYPAQLIHYDIFLSSFGFPVQLLRGGCALSMAIFSWYYLHALRLEKFRTKLPIHSYLKSAFGIVIIFVAFLGLGWVFTDYLGDYAKQKSLKDAEVNISIVLTHFKDQMQKVDQVAVAISGSPWIAPALISSTPEDIARANSVLDRYNKSLGMSVCYLLDMNGIAVAASEEKGLRSFLGQQYGFRPYYSQAISGKSGSYFALGVTSQDRGYYASYPVKDPFGKIVGAVVIKKNIDDFEEYVQGYPHLFLIDPHGVVFLGSDRDVFFHTLWPIDGETKRKLIDSRQFGNNLSTAILPGQVNDQDMITYLGQQFYVMRDFITDSGWSVVFFCPLDRVIHYRLFAILILLVLSLMLVSSYVFISLREDMLLKISAANALLKDEIAGHKKTEEEIKKAYELNHSILEKAPFGIFVVNSHGHIDYVNSAMLEISGNTYEQFISLNVFELSTYKNSGMDRKVKAALEGTPFFISKLEYTSFYGGKKTTRNVTGLPFYELGEKKVLIFVEDISLHKKAEDLRAQLAAIVDFSDDAIIGNNLDGIISSWNLGAEKLYGYSAEEMTGRSLELLVPAEMDNDVPELLKKIRNGESVSHYETQHLTKAGLLIDVALTVSAIKDSQGNVTGASMIARDITERKRLEKIKDEFISNVSHELRTPLSITKEGVSLVLDEVAGAINEKQKKILVSAQDNIDRLARIINGLLDISRIEAGKVDIRRESVVINNLVTRAVSLFEAKAKEKGLQLKTAFSDKEIVLYIDSDKIMQVVTNLLDNAIKFTENGFVEVSLIERDSYVECVIRDSGLGISESDLPKVFNKFQQFGRQAGAGAKGTGLGLVIAKAIVEMHKGRISVESLYGQGTTFKFLLPIYTYDTLVKEYAEAGIKKAHDNNANFSIIVIKVRDLEKLSQMIEPDKIQGLLKDLEGVIKGGLRGAGDTALNNSGEYSIFLNDCGKENALRIEGRIEQMIDEYFSSFNLKERVHLRFICATYPDEARSAQELIVKVKKGE